MCRVGLIKGFLDVGGNIVTITGVSTQMLRYSLHDGPGIRTLDWDRCTSWLLPFHQYGQPKWAAIGRTYAFECASPVPDDKIAHLRHALESLDLWGRVGGS